VIPFLSNTNPALSVAVELLAAAKGDGAIGVHLPSASHWITVCVFAFKGNATPTIRVAVELPAVMER